MPVTGHTTAVRVASSDASGDVVTGLKSITFGPSVNLLDVTDFTDSSAAHVRLAGLTDCTISGSGSFESGDTGQALIRSSFLSGATIWIRVLPGGSTGFKCPCKVQDYKVEASVEGEAMFSFTALGTAAIGTV